MKFLRRLTILFLAAVLAAASFATVFAAADGAGAPAAPSAAPSGGGADGDASAPQTGAEDEAELSLLLPASYEQYLELNAPSSVAATEDYIAVADGNTIYLYDRVNGGKYETFVPQNDGTPATAVGSLNFYEADGRCYLYFMATLSGRNQIRYVDCGAENFSAQTDKQTQVYACNSFVIVEGHVCYVDADGKLYLSSVEEGGDIAGSSEPISIGSGTASPAVTALAVYNGAFYFSTKTTSVEDYPSIYSLDPSAASQNPSFWQRVDHDVSSFAIESGTCYYVAAGTFYRATAGGSDEEIGRGGTVRLCDDGKLYVIGGTSIREYAPDGGYTGYEIGLYSSSANRLGEGAAAISSRGGELLIADTGNGRVLRYRDGGYTVLKDGLTDPALVCAGDGAYAVYHDRSTVTVYPFAQGNSHAHAVQGAVGLAYAYGTFYCVTGNNETYAIAADGSVRKGSIPLGSSAAADLAADVFGNLYVLSGDGNVYLFTDDTFLSGGTALKSVASFGNAVRSLHCAYDGTLYGVSDQSLFVWRESSAAETSLNLSDLVTTPSAAAADLSFDFESGKLYILSDGFIAQGNFDIPSLSNISADGLHDALSGDAASLEELLVEVPAQSVLLDLTEAEIGADAQFLPYKTYERTDAARTGVKVCETSAGTVVAFFRYAPAQGGNSYTPERKYSLALVLGVTAPAGGLQAETPFSAHNTSDVYLYRFPSMHLGNGDNAAAGVARLPRGTAFTVHGYVRGAAGGEGGWGLDSDYAYVTVNATGQKGYIPVSYLAEGGVSGGATEFVYRTVDRGESITLFAGSESITLSGRERVKMYGVPDEAGNVYVTYTDADGRVWAGNVPENCLYEAPASATAVLVAVLAVAAVILVSVCYLLLRRQPALD